MIFRHSFTTIFSLFLVVSLACSDAIAKKRRPASSTMGESQLLRKILEVEDLRLAKDKTVIAALRNPSRRVVRAAILALGRIGDMSALDELARLLNGKDKEIKSLAAFSLGIIGGDVAHKLLTQQIEMIKDPVALGGIFLAIGRTGNEKTVPLFAQWLKESATPKIYDSVAQGLGFLWSGDSAKWEVPPGLLARLCKLAQGNEQSALSAAFALARFKGDPSQLPVADLADAINKSQLVFARAFLLRTMGKLKSPIATTILIKELGTSPYLGIREEAAKGLANQEATENVLNELIKALADKNSSVVFSVLETLSSYSLGAAPKAENVEPLLKHPSVWVKGTALKTLARISPARLREIITPYLADPANPLTPAAAHALGSLGTPADLDRLSPFIESDNVRVAEEAIESLNGVDEGNLGAQVKASLRKALERADVGLTSMVAQIVEKNKWKEFAGPLATVYRLFGQRDQLEAKVAVLTALAVVGDYSHVELIQSAFKDEDRVVVQAAVLAYKAITGKEENSKIPLNSQISFPTPPQKDIDAATKSRFIIKTTRGNIEISMLEEAPLNAANFTRLVKQGFYNGKNFHRIVPNFVAQGGDPRGDGFGGPGYLIRDEISPLKHSRGTIGLATAGKDTGGCQFFVNLSPNPHLDGRYTLFGEVTAGMDVADKLEVGDQILSIKVR